MKRKSFLKSLFLLVFIFLFSSCGIKHLPTLDVSYEPPKLELTPTEIKEKEEAQKCENERAKLQQSIDAAKIFLIEKSTPQVVKFAENNLKETENWLAQALILLKNNKFPEVEKAIDRAKLEINTALEQSKIKQEEEKKKEDAEKRKKEEEEIRLKAEESRKSREKSLAEEAVKNLKLKAEKVITPEFQKYLPKNINDIYELISKAESAIINKEYKNLDYLTKEVENLISNLDNELKLILEKINGEENFVNIKNLIEVKNFGDAYFKLRKFIRDYPDSKYIPESNFLIGICYEEFDNYEKARETFNFVINNYPDTEWSLTAKDHLDIDISKKFQKKAEETKPEEKTKESVELKKEEQQQDTKPKEEKPIEIAQIKQNIEEPTANFVEPLKVETKPLENKADIEKTYKDALDLLLKKNQVEKSRVMFNSVIETNDKNLLDNALYWLGETYYTQKKYAEAIEFFTKAIENNIKSEKDIAAQFKIGLSYYYLKQIDESKKALTSLQAKYPSHELAKKSQTYLDNIEKGKK